MSGVWVVTEDYEFDFGPVRFVSLEMQKAIDYAERMNSSLNPKKTKANHYNVEEWPLDTEIPD